MKKLFSIRTIILAGSLLLQLNTLCIQSRGAAGDVDLSFDPGSGVNGFVWAVAVQPDGMVVIGGDFTTVKGLVRTNVARLNADGSGDATFNSGLAYNAVSSLALQPDGKVLVGGEFVHYECDEFGNCYEFDDWGVIRLNANGSLDNTFTPATAPGYQGGISCIFVQSDGKVLLGGNFNTVNGTNRNGIARLNANGSLDVSFNPGAGASFVRSVVVQSDGKVLLSGGFTTVNGTNRIGIARLNANGSLDSSFNPGVGAGGIVSSVALQADGKVLIGGYFAAVNGTVRNWIARLNTNGSLDASFNPGTGAGSNGSIYGYGVRSVVVQSDGKVLIGGEFTTVNGTNRSGIARLNNNGSLDNTFIPGAAVAGGYGTSVALQSDGKVLIAANRIARLNANGSVDGSFDPGTQVNFFQSLAVQPDGKVLLAGLSSQFAFINGTNRYGSARLNTNGSLDSTFIPGSFNPDIGYLGFPYDYSELTALAVQSDGKVLVAAYYYELFNCDDAGCAYYFSYSITRHNADGSRDTSFEPVVQNSPFGCQEMVTALAVQPDGKVVVGGLFYFIKGANRNSLARLNANGSLDGGFIGAVAFNYQVSSIVAQMDGKVMIAGNFSSIYGVARNGIARLNADGSLDSGFNPGTGFGNGLPYPEIRSVAVQPDGKVLIGGPFTTVNGTNRNRIARLNANGSLDDSFNPGTGADGEVRSIALQSDGNVLIGGDFTTVNGVVRPHVARLYGSSVAPSLSIARSNAFVIVSWPVNALNFQLQESTNLLPAAWSPVAQAAVTNAGQISVTVPTTVGRKFFRLRSQ
jgi:uncharacterized delta-60 repeat protein